MRHALVLMVLVGCATDDVATEKELHELEVCDAGWATQLQPFEPGITQCEAACADARAIRGYQATRECYVDVESRFGSPGRVPGERLCSTQTNWGGHEGCCIPDTAPVLFVECKAN